MADSRYFYSLTILLPKGKRKCLLRLTKKLNVSIGQLAMDAIEATYPGFYFYHRKEIKK